jgi:hypothetical protein
MRSPLVPYTSRRLSVSQTAARSRPGACTATNPPVMKNDAWRSRSVARKAFCTALGSKGTDSGSGSPGGGSMRRIQVSSRGPAASVIMRRPYSL